MKILQRVSLAIVSVCLAARCAHANRVPNLNWLGRGYDILKGNPHPTRGQDFGWSAQVIEEIYDERTFSMGGEWYDQPVGVDVHSCSRCNYDFTTSDIMTTTEYKNYLRQSVDTDFSGAAASFKASVDFKHVSERAEQNHEYVMESMASCNFYCAIREAYMPPALSTNFYNAVNTLDNMTAALEFIDAFGTHYVDEVTMGGLVGTRYHLTEESYQSMVDNGLNVQLAASYSGIVNSGNFNSLTELQRSDAETFSSSTTERAIFTIGGQPPVDASNPFDTTDWYNNAAQDPFPIAFRLENLQSLLTEVNFPDIVDIEQKRAVLTTAMGSYCGELEAQGEIQCEDQDPSYGESRAVIWAGPFGSSGKNFNDEQLWNNFHSQEVTGVRIQTTHSDRDGHQVIASIQMLYPTYASPIHGDSEQRDNVHTHEFLLARGEHIRYVFLCHELSINTLQFRTNTGRASPIYGARAYSEGVCEESYFDNRVLYIDGTAGWFLDGITFYFEAPDLLSESVEIRDDNFQLLTRHNNVANGFFSSSVLNFGVENMHNLYANTFSIIGVVDPASFELENGRYEFELIYDNFDGTRDVLRWSQTSWLTEGSVVDADVSAIIPNSDVDGIRFGGLARSSTSYTFLDGSPGHGDWWNAVVSVQAHENGIPAHGGKIAWHSELWVRRG